MKKTFLKYSIGFLLGLTFINPVFSFQQQEKPVEYPEQFKPERIKVLEQIANETIKNNDYPFKNEKDVENFEELIRKEQEILDSTLITENVKKQYRSVSLDFSPTNEFKKFFFVYGFTTTIAFFDKEGNPWDIVDISPGNKQLFDIKYRAKNILTISPQKLSGTTNLTLMLKDAKLPLSVDLVINKENVDYVAQVDVDGYGNNTKQYNTVNYNSSSNRNSLSSYARSEEEVMAEIITNTKPSNMEEKKVEINSRAINPNEFRAFIKDKYLYVRTVHQAFSPAAVAMKKAPDGKTKVFIIPYVKKPIFLVDGKTTTLTIK
tara:strand:+ start:138375 stop:139331 length:957 start_codon:yes stop_codon:yes gene_type:complete